MYHVDLRSGVHGARAFNLSEDELESRFLVSFRAGRTFSYEDREWDPSETQLTVFEAGRLRPDQIGMGRGWANVQKRGTDVTTRLLGSAPPQTAATVAEDSPRSQPDPRRPPGIDRLQERLIGRLGAGPLELHAAVTMAAELLPGHRASEQLALAEQAVWEMLHRAGVGLEVDGRLALREEWERLLLTIDTWLAGRARLTRGS